MWTRGVASRVATGLLMALICGTGVWAQDMEWVRQFGTTEFDHVRALAIDSMGAYIGGYTYVAAPHPSSRWVTGGATRQMGLFQQPATTEAP
jgi:hypothetical protein